ncbi:ATP-binding protein [Holdemanella porci]|uniref:ATP-binding protein n=1 Tax=Holdemanella porci TaxID=2652276 RepID=UPI001C2CA3D8|nr:ATP-binding protein [Holdemanella porci]MBU9871822.1 ATP-binding protein [Holdemanella porci]
MAGLDKQMLQVIEHLAKNEIQAAKNEALKCCELDTTKKNEVQLRYYKKLLENGNTSFVELPSNLEGILKKVDVSGFQEDKYYLGEKENEILQQIQKNQKVYSKMLTYGVHMNNSVLLYGEPGTGKTEFAKYVAYKMGVPYIYLNFANTIDSFMGQTAKNIERVFDYCKGQKCVLMLDEIDCIGMLRGGKGVDGELSRITITLMQCLDAMVDGQIVIGATNRKDMIDGALLRRFHKIYEIARYSQEEQKKMIEKWLISLDYNDFKKTVNIDDLASKEMTQNEVISTLKDELCEHLIQHEMA